MRFRYMQMADIPDAMKLYAHMNAERRDAELAYPIHQPQDVDAFAMSLARHLMGNPGWFAICGVVGSSIHEDPQGIKHVIGGRTKAFIACSITERTVGTPRVICFAEMMIVDPQFRKHNIARKITQAAFIEGTQRGVQVFECAWNPGSLGEELWLAAGLKPYRVLGAWITDDGTSREDVPLAKSFMHPASEAEVEVQAEPEPVTTTKRRGRPPKNKPTEGT